MRSRCLLCTAHLSILLSAVPFARADNEVARKVSVTGTAVIFATPDSAVWSLNSTNTHASLPTAKEDSDRNLKAILTVCRSLGVSDGDVQTGRVDIDRVFENDRNGNPKVFLHFMVRRTVTVRLRDLKRFDEFLAKLITAAEVQLSLSLETSREIELRQEARLKALALAKAKAEAMCGALGAKLGRVLTIDEDTPRERSFGFEANSNSIQYSRLVPPDLTSGTFSPGASPVRATVHVVFAIE